MERELIMIRRHALLFGLVVLVAACGGEATSETSTPTTAAASSETTIADAPATTTSAPTTVPPATSTTTTSTTTSTTAAPVVTGGTLEDGRPATFVAITDDYAAVEVDTLTGEILHEFGQTGTAAELEAAEEMPPNVLVGIWRLLDGSVVGISDCCEPAAGNIFYVAAAGQLGSDPYHSEWKEHGWSLSASPTQNMFANLGYAMVVADPNVTADTGPGQWIDEPSLGFPYGAAAWDRDGSQLWWTTKIGEVAALATLDLAEGAPTHVTVLSWVDANERIDGIGSQASGNLVGFLHSYNADYEATETTGVVFSTEGQLVAGFPVETGSTFGGYDPSGTFLLYVDADGMVRWQGGGQSGALGAGFVFASW